MLFSTVTQILILPKLQLGVSGVMDRRNRFNGFSNFTNFQRLVETNEPLKRLRVPANT
jgi:hypothetical protein